MPKNISPQPKKNNEPVKNCRKNYLNKIVLVLLALVPLITVACGYKTINRGYILDKEKITQISIGTPQEEVDIILGSPSSKTVVRSDDWYYYISAKIQLYTTGIEKEISRNIIAIAFDKRKNVKNIYRINLKDGKIIKFLNIKNSSNIKNEHLIKLILNDLI